MTNGAIGAIVASGLAGAQASGSRAGLPAQSEDRQQSGNQHRAFAWFRDRRQRGLNGDAAQQRMLCSRRVKVVRKRRHVAGRANGIGEEVST